MDEVLNASQSWRDDPRLHVNVVGSGNPSKLLVPPHLKTRVTPHVNLKFPEFYELVGGSARSCRAPRRLSAGTSMRAHELALQRARHNGCDMTCSHSAEISVSE